MTGQPPLELDLARLPSTAIVADIVYVPLETAFLASARERGNRVVPGLGMLLASGGARFRIVVRREAGRDPGSPRLRRRRISSGAIASHECHRPHRLDRHGQDRDREDVRRTRRSGLRFRCHRARLYAKGGAAVAPVGRAFPGAVTDGAIDRAALVGNAGARSETLLPASKRSFIRWCAPSRNAFSPTCRSEGHKLRRARYSAPVRDRARERRRYRGRRLRAGRHPARPRPGAARHDRGEACDAILARQMPDAEKRRRADFIVDSGQGLDHACAQVRRYRAELDARAR